MGLTLPLGIRTGSEAGVWNWDWAVTLDAHWAFPLACSSCSGQHTMRRFCRCCTSAETLLYFLDEIFFELVLAYNK